MVRLDLLRAIQREFRERRHRFTLHGLQEATADEITVHDVRDAIMGDDVEIIEDYPDDPRGPSCLLLAWASDRTPLHVVVSYPPDPAVITAYVPDPERWIDLRTRR